MIVYEVMDCDVKDRSLGLFTSIDVAKVSLRISWCKYNDVHVVYDGRFLHVSADGLPVKKYPVEAKPVITEPEHL